MSLGLAILIFFVMLFIGTPIAICLAGTGIIWLLSDPTLPSLVFATKIYGATDSFALMAIPFFMMAGQIMEQTGITERFIDFAKCKSHCHIGKHHQDACEYQKKHLPYHL